VCVETLLEIKEFNLTQQTHPNLRYQILWGHRRHQFTCWTCVAIFLSTTPFCYMLFLLCCSYVVPSLWFISCSFSFVHPIPILSVSTSLFLNQILEYPLFDINIKLLFLLLVHPLNFPIIAFLSVKLIFPVSHWIWAMAISSPSNWTC
jgi:hypothetical protein